MQGGGVRRHGLRRQGDAGRSAMAARCSCSRTSSTSSARAGSPRRSWPAWQRAAEEHLAVRLADPEPRRRWARTSCCRAARSTTWRPSSRRSISSSRASRARTCSPTSSSTSTAANRAPSAPPSSRAPVGQRRQTTFIGLDAVHDDSVHDDAQRRHALLLLQEQVPADVHRRQDRDVESESGRRQDQGSAAGGASG